MFDASLHEFGCGVIARLPACPQQLQLGTIRTGKVIAARLPIYEVKHRRFGAVSRELRQSASF
jgi:hypothetical protein